jgi:hypothetical protein
MSVSLSPNVLWPPNGKLVPITANIHATDACSQNPSITLVSITSSEPGTGEIQRANFGTDDLTFSLQAARLGTGPGRVYTITYQATDAVGNSATASGTVTVPHDQGH